MSLCAEQVASCGANGTRNGTPVGLTGSSDYSIAAAHALGRMMEGPTAVIAKFDYTYDHHGQTISIKKGESFNLLSKATSDWWHVRRKQGGVLEDLYVPATYVQEVKNSIKAAIGTEATLTKQSSLPRGIHLAGQAEPKDGDCLYENVAKLRGGSTGPFHSPPVAKKPQLAARSVALGQNSKERPRSFFGGSENTLPSELIQSLVDAQSKLAPKTGHQHEDVQLKSPSTGQSAQGEEVPPLSPFPTDGLYDRLGAPGTLPTMIAEPPCPVATDGTEETLPPGWNEYRTPEGKMYYHNEKTGMSSWMKPKGATRKRKGSIPRGWLKEVNPFGQPIYINVKSKEKWALGVTASGQRHFYNMANPQTSLKELPEESEDVSHASDNGPSSPGGTAGPQLEVVSDVLQRLISAPADAQDRTEGGKSKPHQRSSSVDMLGSNPFGSLQDNSVSRHGYLNRKRLFDSSGKKSTSRQWLPVYVMLQNHHLEYYKDHKVARESNAKPQGVFCLVHANVKVATSNLKRKFVLEVSAQFGEQFYLQADNQKMMDDWYIGIYRAIEKANEEYKRNPSSFQLPTSPTSPNASPNQPKKPSAHKRKESNVSVMESDDEEDMGDSRESKNLRDRLNKLVSRRSTMEQLKLKGIYKDQALVFGCPLDKLCAREKSTFPKFIAQCIKEVERRGLNSQGIYRLSGNAAEVTKLRYLVDQEEAVDLSAPQWEDINVVTGALKLFFRELPDPVIPSSLYQKFIDSARSAEVEKRVPALAKCVKELPKVNYQVLKTLLIHLLKVIEHSAENKMQAQNVAIVFGPTLLRTENPLLIATLAPVQNNLVQTMLTDFDAVFTS